MFYRINWHAATRRVLLESNASAAPAAIGGAYTNLGTFEHDNEDEKSTGLNGMQGLADNHVPYQHVQDALYKIGVFDMRTHTIILNKNEAPEGFAFVTALTRSGSVEQVTAQNSSGAEQRVLVRIA